MIISKYSYKPLNFICLLTRSMMSPSLVCFMGLRASTFAFAFSGRGVVVIRTRTRTRTLFQPPTSLTVVNEADGDGDGETFSANIKQDWKSKAKGSAQLNRWSRARALRCGKRRLDKGQNRSNVTWTNHKIKNQVTESECVQDSEEENLKFTSGKAIYMVSDGTGWTAEHSVNAALGQFEHCLADRGCAVNTHLFSGIDEVDELLEIIRQAAKEEAAILYTLADPNMAEAARRGCEMWKVPHTDILGPTTEAIGRLLGVAPLGLPRGNSPFTLGLSEHYFKRIEAVEFSIKQDDGALPQNLLKADMVLVGVSRTSKTPLSTYLAHKGYKVANIPLVLGLHPPKHLFQTQVQDKIYGLIISPAILQSIRLARANTLGLQSHSHSSTTYSEMDHIRQELNYANKLFAQNPRWPVIDVTGKAIEETAAVVLRIYHEKTHKYAMPRISKRY